MRTIMVSMRGEWNELTLDIKTIDLAVQSGELIPDLYDYRYDDQFSNYVATSEAVIEKLIKEHNA